MILGFYYLFYLLFVVVFNGVNFGLFDFWGVQQGYFGVSFFGFYSLVF